MDKHVIFHQECHVGKFGSFNIKTSENPPDYNLFFKNEESENFVYHWPRFFNEPLFNVAPNDLKEILVNEFASWMSSHLADEEDNDLPLKHFERYAPCERGIEWQFDFIVRCLKRSSSWMLANDHTKEAEKTGEAFINFLAEMSVGCDCAEGCSLVQNGLCEVWMTAISLGFVHKMSDRVAEYYYNRMFQQYLDNGEATYVEEGTLVVGELMLKRFPDICKLI